jgi:hypothetical protein
VALARLTRRIGIPALSGTVVRVSCTAVNMIEELPGYLAAFLCISALFGGGFVHEYYG